MKDLSKSAFIFDLADEFEIFSLSGTTNAFTDEAFNLFCDKYKSLSKQRDTALFHYLNSTPNLFRTHLPYSSWAISFAFSLVWYYDELVVSDPVLQLINSNKASEHKKHQLQQLLTFLKDCRKSIDGGFLLFSGDNLTPGKTGNFQEDGKLLLEKDRILLESYQNNSQFFAKPALLRSNDETHKLTQLVAEYEGLIGAYSSKVFYHGPPFYSQSEPDYNIINHYQTPFIEVSVEYLKNLGKDDFTKSLVELYNKDVEIILETITNAQRLNLSTLFYREVDYIAARSYAVSNNRQTKDLLTDTTVYDCLVPYVEGIPPERLFDVRNQVPEAFKDFRAFLFELVMKTMKSTDNSDEFKFKVDNEINKLMRQLNVEMNNAKNKWKFQGVAAPLIMLTGSLTLLSSGIDYSKLLSTFLGSGGLIQSLNTWNNVSADKNKSSLNPVYFLWKAQQL